MKRSLKYLGVQIGMDTELATAFSLRVGVSDVFTLVIPI